MGIDVWCLRDASKIDTHLQTSIHSSLGKHFPTDDLLQIPDSKLEQWLIKQSLLNLRTGNITVQSLGDPNASLLVLSQCKIADEFSHQPFPGKSGVLLRAMLNSISIDFSEVMISELDTPHSADSSLKNFLKEKKIRVILLLVDLPQKRYQSELSNIREQVYVLDDFPIKVQVSFHPNYLLNQPKAKSLAWQDLKAVQKALESQCQ